MAYNFKWDSYILWNKLMKYACIKHNFSTPFTEIVLPLILFFCLFFVRRDSLQKLDLFVLHIIFISIIHMSKHNFIGIL